MFQHTFTTTWVHQGYTEPNACVVAFDACQAFAVWANNKVPYTLRKQLADALGFAEAPDRRQPWRDWPAIFGGKSPAMNVPLAYFLALRAGRPVKMIMSYTEEVNGWQSPASRGRHHQDRGRNALARSGRGTAPWRTRAGPTAAPGAAPLPGSRDAAGGQYHIPHVQVDSYIMYTNNGALRLLLGCWKTDIGRFGGGSPYSEQLNRRHRQRHAIPYALPAPQRTPGWPGVRHRATKQARAGRSPPWRAAV